MAIPSVGGGAAQVMHMDSYDTLAFTAGSTTSYGPVTGHAVSLTADADCLIRTGASGESIIGTDDCDYLPAGVKYPIQVGRLSEHIHVKGKSGSGTLYIVNLG